MLSSVLVATDVSHRSVPPLLRGKMLADSFDARLTVLHVLDDDAGASGGQRAEAIGSLERHLADVLQDTAKVEACISVGDPFEEILDCAGERQAEVIVVGAPRRRRFLDFFTGTTAERVIRGSSVPVLSVHSEPRCPWRHVLCAFDASDGAATAVRAARSLGFLDGTVTLLHVVDPLAQMGMATRGARQDVIARHRRAEEVRVAGEARRLIGELDLQGTARMASADGRIGPTIIDQAARAEAELIVMGTRDGADLKRFLLGNVAAHVLAEATIDVLAVPEGATRA